MDRTVVKADATAGVCENDAFRRRVRALIADFVPPRWRGIGALEGDDRTAVLSRWRERLRDNNLLAVGWPAQYGGGGLGVAEESILAEECVLAGLSSVPHPNDGFGFGLLGPTLLHWGDEAQKKYFLPRTISGEIRWAQGYSESEAGSDRFGLRTRAVARDDEWIVNGHKIWQTGGLTANWIFALVRTDPTAVRSRGISFLLIPLNQPGIEVRGIRNAAGTTEFAEVFFTDARTSINHVVGGVNNGAKVALTLLGFERGAGAIATAAAMRIELRRLMELAIAEGRNTDSAIRERIAQHFETVHALGCVAAQSLQTVTETGTLGPESSITKLVTAEHRQGVTELAIDLLGEKVLTPTGAPAVNHLGPQSLGADPQSASAWVTDFLFTRPGTVYGGSSEIQRDTIAEQILGLPREPRPIRNGAR